MSALKIIAIVLILAGIAGLAYGKFSYTAATHEAKVGPFDFAVKEKKSVNIPMWVSAGSVVAGVLLLLAPKRT